MGDNLWLVLALHITPATIEQTHRLTDSALTLAEQNQNDIIEIRSELKNTKKRAD